MKKLAVAFAFVVPACQIVTACTCMPPGRNIKNMRELAEAYANMEGVSSIFIGRVEKQEVKAGTISPGNAMSMTSNGTYRVVSIAVSEGFRGKANSTVKVFTNFSEAGCGYDFELGKEYLVYASSLPDGNFATTLCSGTNLAEHAGPAIRQLRNQSPAKEDLLDQNSYFAQMYPTWTGKVCGHVFLQGKPVGEAQVDLTQVRDEEPFPPNVFSDPDLSKSDGSYCISAVAPGRYRLSAEVSDYDHNQRSIGYWETGMDRKSAQVIEVKAGQQASWFDVQLQTQELYTVLVRLVTSDGTPAPSHLGVAINSPTRDARSYSNERNGPEEGAYGFYYVPPGDYTIETYPVPDFKDGSEVVPDDVRGLKMSKFDVTISRNMRLTVKVETAESKK
jgi:hypothetical protein